MCFSAGASFTMAGVLTVIGGASIGSSAEKPRLFFAAIPLAFAAQQAIEGIVWLTFDAPAHQLLHRIAVLAFLVFALVIWPTWVPFSVRAAERNGERRRWLAWIAWFGVAVSLGALALLVWWAPGALVERHSIHYSFGNDGGTAVHVLLIAAYLVPTIVPFFVATINLAKTFGVALIISLIATFAIRAGALTSVWCFFAAGLSVLVFISVRRRVEAENAGAA